MANGIAPIVSNAVRHPRQIAESLKAHPYRLGDETTETVKELAKALVRAGHREELLAISDANGIDEARRAVIRSACTRVHLH